MKKGIEGQRYVGTVLNEIFLGELIHIIYHQPPKIKKTKIITGQRTPLRYTPQKQGFNKALFLGVVG